MLNFTVTELDRRELPAAWPLVRTVAPGLDLDRWLEFAEILAARGGGVIGVAAEDGGFHGIATYEPVEKLHSGKVLQVDSLVSFELTRRAPVRQILCEALDRLASQLGCEAVAVSIPSRSYVAQLVKNAKALKDVGHRVDDVVFLKRLADAGTATATA